MAEINLETIINGKKGIVFDLSRSIDLHKISTKDTNEEAVSGKTNGLIELNECVTWKAKHFGVYQYLTSKITSFEYPNHFTDEMQKGIFKSFKHEHFFTESNGETTMTDVFNYTSPFGILGIIADKLFLKSYMTKLLSRRNAVIKDFAESNKWQNILTAKSCLNRCEDDDKNNRLLNNNSTYLE